LKDKIESDAVLRIAMITSEFPPKWGGVGNYSYFHGNILAQKGHKVTVYTREQNKIFKDHHKNLSIKYVKWLKLPLFFTTSMAKNAMKEIKSSEDDYDILQVQSNMALLQKEHYNWLKIPIISTLHGTWLGERSTVQYKHLSLNLASINDLSIKWFAFLLDKYEDYAIENSHAVVIGARSECKAVSQRGIKNRYDRVVRIQHGVDTESFHPDKKSDDYKQRFNIPDEKKVILHVGRLAARKGCAEVLISFKKVLKERSDVKLLIVGTGPLEKRLKKLAVKLNIEKDTIFTGTLPFNDIQMLYASSDIFLMHSYWEGFGMTNQEALASGMPVICTNVGGAPDIIKEGYNGYLVDVGDTDAMAKYSLKLLKDEDLFLQMRKNARKSMVDGFKWHDMVDNYLKLYEQILEDPKNTKGLPRIGKKCF
jgi:glycosyltransferase involved in cell wall biosynthesis